MEEIVHFAGLFELEAIELVIGLLQCTGKPFISRKTVLALEFREDAALIAVITAKHQQMIAIFSALF